MNLTVQEALATTALRQGTLLGGATGVAREISWVTVVEVLEDINRLAPGEFLITTAYGLEDDPAQRERFIQSLAQRRLAGVGVLTGFYIPEITPDLIAAADQYNIPLIELPGHLSFSDITRSILSRIMREDDPHVDAPESIHQELLQLLLSGKGFPFVAEMIASRTGSMVSIFDPDWRLLSRAVGTGILNPDRLAGEVVGTCQSEGPDTLLRNKEVVSFEIIHDISPVHNLAVTIMAENRICGFLTLSRPETDFDQLDRDSLVDAARVCGLEFLRLKAIEETEWRMQADFLEEVLAGKWFNTSLIAEKGRTMGFDFTKPHNIMTVRVSPLNGDKEDVRLHEGLHRLHAIAREAFAESGIKTLCKMRHESLIILLEGDVLSKDQVSAAAHKVQGRWLEAVPDTNIFAGIGNNRCNIEELAKCAEEADLALKFGRQLMLCDTVCFYDDLGIFSWLIDLHESRVDLRSMAEELLGRLIAYDKKRGNHLLETLETYLAHNQNIQRTANVLFIHRHSLTYRLKRVKDMTGMDLKNHNHRLQLQFALYIHRFLEALE